MYLNKCLKKRPAIYVHVKYTSSANRVEKEKPIALTKLANPHTVNKVQEIQRS